jgi:hypothetical protein
MQRDFAAIQNTIDTGEILVCLKWIMNIKRFGVGVGKYIKACYLDAEKPHNVPQMEYN